MTHECHPEVSKDPERSRGAAILGLVGGLGLEAGIFYYQHIAKAHRERSVPLQMVLVHADAHKCVGLVAAGEHDLLAQYLIGIVRQLAAGGAEVAAIPAVTPHICIDAVVEAAPIPIVNMLEALAAELERLAVRRIALLGTRFVIESDLYGALPPSVEAIHPTPGEIARIDALYRNVALNGEGGADEREEFNRIGRELCRREGLDAVVLAGTDLSALFEVHAPTFPYVDASLVHIEAIMQRLRVSR